MIRPSSPVCVFTDRMVGLKNIRFRPGSCPHGPEGGNKKYQPLELALRPVRVLTDRIVGIKKLKNN